MKVQQVSRDLKYEETQTDGDTVRHWTGQVTQTPANEKDIADYVSFIPSLSFTTLESYESLGKAYYDGARPRVQVTPAIQTLADEITAGRAAPREQAEAIFEWVSKSIQYVAVYFGAGRYVPNDVDTILSRRFGDCKDHVALMSALLKAKGIASEHALINTGPFRILPTTPILQAFNHVIIYLPAFDVYADPTTPTSTFSVLPRSLMDKPVLRTSDTAAIVARTPVGTPKDNEAVSEIRLTIDAKGRPHLESFVEGRGEEAQILRDFAYRSEVVGTQTLAQNLLKAFNLNGELMIAAPSSRDHTEPYKIKFSWTADKPGKLTEAQWVSAWLLAPMIADASQFFGTVDGATPRKFPAVCRPGHMVQTVFVEMPKDVLITPLPGPVTENTPVYSFKKEWTFSGHVLKMRTDVQSKTPSRTCTPETIQAIARMRAFTKQKRNPPLRYVRPQGPGSAPAAQSDRFLAR